MPPKKQLRITIPSWIADLKGWDENSNLQIIPIVKDEKGEVSKDSAFIVKEVKNGKKKK